MGEAAETTVANHQELDVTIRVVSSVGSFVDFDGQEGFIDQTKHPSWWADTEPPRAGDRVHVVVLDDSRTPPRLSALEDDIEIGRRLRGDST